MEPVYSIIGCFLEMASFHCGYFLIFHYTSCWNLLNSILQSSLTEWGLQSDENGVLHLPIFAAAFMDCVDPPQDMSVDTSSIYRMNGTFG